MEALKFGNWPENPDQCISRFMYFVHVDTPNAQKWFKDPIPPQIYNIFKTDDVFHKCWYVFMAPLFNLHKRQEVITERGPQKDVI